MKRLFYFLLFILTIQTARAGNPLPYVSPGVRVGYGFGQAITLNLKISVGLMRETPRHYLEFYNLTYGYKFVFLKQTEDLSDNFHYLDAQYGVFPQNADVVLNFFNGGGLGVLMYNKSGERKFGFRSSIFTGIWIFPGLEMNVYSPDKIHFDLGIKGVLPIPLKHVDL